MWVAMGNKLWFWRMYDFLHFPFLGHSFFSIVRLEQKMLLPWTQVEESTFWLSDTEMEIKQLVFFLLEVYMANLRLNLRFWCRNVPSVLGGHSEWDPHSSKSHEGSNHQMHMPVLHDLCIHQPLPPPPAPPPPSILHKMGHVQMINIQILCDARLSQRLVLRFTSHHFLVMEFHKLRGSSPLRAISPRHVQNTLKDSIGRHVGLFHVGLIL